MESLVEIAHKAIADYGFRQEALWSPDGVIDRWGLSSKEAKVLTGALNEALAALPIPVEPEKIPSELERITKLIKGAL
jgi:hypothetical protein